MYENNFVAPLSNFWSWLIFGKQQYKIPDVQNMFSEFSGILC